MSSNDSTVRTHHASRSGPPSLVVTLQSAQDKLVVSRQPLLWRLELRDLRESTLHPLRAIVEQLLGRAVNRAGLQTYVHGITYTFVGTYTGCEVNGRFTLR